MKNWKDKIAPLVFLAPWIVGFLILTLLPMAMSLYFSFTNYNLLTPPKFIGLSNYVKNVYNGSSFYECFEGHIHLCAGISASPTDGFTSTGNCPE